MWGSTNTDVNAQVQSAALTVSICAFIISVLYVAYQNLLQRFRTTRRAEPILDEKPTSKLSPPRSPDNIHLSRRHQSKQGTPVTTAIKHSRVSQISRYGLAAGEAASFDDDLEGSGDELTARELRRLNQSPSFRYWCAQKHLTADDLENTSRRLKLYHSLRKLHPTAFWQLCSSTSRIGVDSRAPSVLVLIVEYIVSTALALTVVGAGAFVYYQKPHPAVSGALIATAWFLTARQWLQNRPSAGPLFSLWYEDIEWGHAVPAWRAVLANVLEVFYVIATLGVGAVVSVFMKVTSEEHRSVGERLAGVQLVQEFKIKLDE